MTDSLNVKGIEMDKKEVEQHNLSVRIKKAAVANEHEKVCEIAQEIFDAGFELEEMKLLPVMSEVIQGILISSEWTPSMKNSLDA